MQPQTADTLRQRSKALLDASAGAPDRTTPLQDLRQLTQELSIYQTELELQNDQLEETLKALHETKDRLSELFEHAPVGYVVLDASGIVRRINATSLTQLDRTAEEVVGIAFTEFLHPEDSPVFLARFRTFFRNPADKQMVLRLRRKAGGAFYAQIEASPREKTNPAGEIRSELMVIVSDISELWETRRLLDERHRQLEQAHRREKRLNSILRGIRNVNQLITQENNRQRLIDGTCLLLTADMSYFVVWIALLEEKEHRLLAFACSGLPDNGAQLRQQLAQGAFPICLQRALQEKQLVAIANPSWECGTCPHSQHYPQSAALSSRLAWAGKTYGVLTAVVPQECQQDAEEFSLFKEMASDLAFALHKIEQEEIRRATLFQLEEVVHASQLGFWDWDLTSQRLHYSREWKARLGYAEDEIGDQYAEWESRVHPEDLPMALAWVRQMIETRAQHCPHEFRMRHRDGSWRWIDAQGTVITDASGQPIRVIGTLQDATVRKQQEEKISLLGKMLDASPVCITIHDSEGRFLYANQAAANLHGYVSVEEFLTVGYARLNTPESLARMPEKTVLDGVRMEVEHLRKDGSTFPLEILIQSILWEGRSAVLCVASDISERRKNEEARKANESLLRSVVDNIPFELWAYNLEGRIILQNKQILAKYGDQMGKRTEEMKFSPEELAVRIRQNQRAYAGEVVDEEVTYTMPGQTLHFRNIIAPILDGPRMHGIVALSIDITEKKHWEEARSQLLRELQQKKDAAESANRAKGEFLAVMSHEMRTPLNAILGFTELLLEDFPTGKVHDYLTLVYQAGERQLRLVDSILQYARLEKGHLQPTLAEIPLSSFCQSLLNNFRGVARHLQFHCLDGFDAWLPLSAGLVVRTAPDMLQGLLEKLLDNACKYTKQGSVTLAVGMETGTAQVRRVRFEVRDTGIGIAPAHLSKLFLPFSQVDSSYTRDFEGAGLGLALCKQMVEILQGEIGVLSRPGLGSCFWFELPLEIVSSSGVPIPDARQTATTAKLARAPLQILIVDDHPDNAMLARVILEKAGAVCQTADSGAIALQLCQTQPYDLILMDLAMPEMDGFTTAERLRAQPGPNQHTPIAAVTADVSQSGHQRCEQAGFIDRITKPFHSEDLTKLLQEVIDRKMN